MIIKPQNKTKNKKSFPGGQTYLTLILLCVFGLDSYFHYLYYLLCKLDSVESMYQRQTFYFQKRHFIATISRICLKVVDFRFRLSGCILYLRSFLDSVEVIMLKKNNQKSALLIWIVNTRSCWRIWRSMAIGMICQCTRNKCAKNKTETKPQL